MKPAPSVKHASIKHIAVLAPNWLGDAAMATPVLRVLHKRFPDAQQTVVARPAVRALLDGLPYVNRFITIPDKAGIMDMVRARRHVDPIDLAVILPHSFRSALLARMLGARRRLGYDRAGRRFLLTTRVPPYRVNSKVAPIYMTLEYLHLVEAIGCADDGEGLELHAPSAEVDRIKRVVAGDGPLIAFTPGAAFGPAKLWPPERYAVVADTLREQIGARCIVLTGPGEEEVRTAVQRAAKQPLIEVDSGAPSLDTLKAAIAQSDLLIGNDSGPRHIAVALGVPVVCVMGPTAPVYSEGPYEVGRVLRVDVDCGPCQQPVCRTDHRCMTRISPEWVAETAQSILRKNIAV